MRSTTSLKRSLGRAVLAGDEYRAIFFYRDVVALGALADAVDGLAAGADDKSDLIDFDVGGEDLRRTRADVGARLRDLFGR